MAFESMYFPQSVFYGHAHDIAFCKSEGLRASMGMQSHFQLPGVRTFTITVAHYPYSVSGSSFGSDLYRENQLTGSFGFDIRSDFRACVSIALLNYWVQDHCNRYGYAVHVSSSYALGVLTIGGWLNNINMPHLYDNDAIPMTYTARAQYDVCKNLACIIAARGTDERLPFFNVGVSWVLHPCVVIGVGANTDPLCAEYMVRLPLGRIGIHCTGTFHEYLGPSHAMRVAFEL